MKKLTQIYFFMCLSYGAMAQQQEQPNPLYNRERIGCVCKDGTRSEALGMGACSNHGGVRHWLYADVSVYRQYSQNLPAIPDNKLIRLTPEQVRGFLKVIETLPAIPKKPKHKKGAEVDEPTREDDIKDAKDREESEEDEKAVEKPKRSHSVRDCPCEESSWKVQDFLLPFVLVLCIILLFIIIFYAIKKILQ